MVFSSIAFLFYFLPVVVLLYFLSPQKYRNGVLLLLSLIFYAWGEPTFIFVMLVSIFVNYGLGLAIGRENTSEQKAKVFLWAGVAANLGLLIYFKYFMFLMGFVNSVFGRLHIPQLSIPEIALPIGLSFFTFQGMSYVIDVYRKKVPVQKSLVKLALYIALFPQLIAGPIVRYADVQKEIDHRSVSFADVYAGVQRFIIGLAKKVMIADMMASVAHGIFENALSELTPGIAWFGAICYAMQIYFDFSGYSDMAIGLGRIFGFHFLENFNLPYLSKSISEFWRRWHISLGSWFRDYVYIPLGGSRRGNVYLNLLVVFLLTGIWHGAANTFILWGLWHGFFVVAERALSGMKRKIVVPGFIKWLYTMLVVLIGWIFFRAGSVRIGLTFLQIMCGRSADAFHPYSLAYYADKQILFTLLCAVFLSAGIPGKIAERYPKLVQRFAWVREPYLLFVFFCSVCMIVNGNFSPFIYFRF